MTSHDRSEQTARILGRLTALEALATSLVASHPERRKALDVADALVASMLAKGNEQAAGQPRTPNIEFAETILLTASETLAVIRTMVKE